MKRSKFLFTGSVLGAAAALLTAGCNQDVSQGVVIKASTRQAKESRSETPTSNTTDDDVSEKKSVAEATASKAPATESSAPDWEDLSAAKFSSPLKIDNVWFPLKPGTQLTWYGTSVDDEGDKKAHWVIFTVTDLTREVAGIKSVVCWDQDYEADADQPFENADLIESEVVYFAQADDGTVWHLGQYPEEYDEGKTVATPGWLHGLKDGKAGIYMPAQPVMGSPSFSQGWAPSIPWTDRAVLYQEKQEAKVPAGHYTDVIVFDETSKEEPDGHALKYYAQGVGCVKVGYRGESPDQEVLELTKIHQLNDEGMVKAREAAQKLEKNADQYFTTLKGEVTQLVAANQTEEPTPAASSDVQKVDPASLGTEEFGLTTRQLAQKIEQVESLIAKCMREEGFEYVACDYQTVRKGMTADKSMPGMNEEEFIAKFGFGISTTYTGEPPQLAAGYSPTRVGLGERNVEIFKNLSPADQAAYNRALFGENLDASFAMGLETENFARCGGCTRKAIEQVFRPEELRATYYNPKDALINKDPRMQAALRKYAEAMRSEGFSYNHPDEVETDLRDRLTAITGGESIPVAKLPREKQEALKKLQDYELRVSKISFDLQGELFDPVETQIERELFAREVK